jgi:regulator of RNase E activity RraA
MSNANGPRTSHISDAADLLGVGIRQGAGGFFYLGDPDATAIGRAFTVRQVLAETLQSGAKPEARHGEAADRLASPGEILVIAIDGATEAATWGEAHTLRSIRRGLAGVLIDGATRDFAALGRRRFPVLCRASSPVRSSGRLHTVAMNTEVAIAGVSINAGDLIAIDGDGFVSVPAEYAQDVLAEAEKIRLREETRDREIQKREASSEQRRPPAAEQSADR